MSLIAKSPETLRKRLRRFFEDVPDERRPLTTFVRNLNEVTHALVFGGLIRDICLHGIKPFKSDVDLVVHVQDRQKFESLLQNIEYSRNKFGGYRIHVSRWIIDLWEFEETWAFREGLVDPKNDDALLATTFFNWDAILYDLDKKSLNFHEDYFDSLIQKTLDLNLEQTPNEFGSFVRSLRMISREKAKTTKALSKFICDKLEHYSDTDILEYEKNHFSANLLTQSTLLEFRSKMAHWNGENTFAWQDQNQGYLFQ